MSHARRRAQLTQGPIGQQLYRMTKPMLVGMLGVMLFNIVDTFFIAQLGLDELAAISFTFPVVLAVGSLSMGLGSGASAFISKAIGEHNTQQVKHYTTYSLLLAFVIISIVALIGFHTITPLFTYLGAPEHLLPHIHAYMQWWYPSILLLAIPMVGNNAIRATGDTKTPSQLMLLSLILNIILDPLLIFGLGPIPGMGIEGAAIATIIARFLTLVGALWMLGVKLQMLTLSNFGFKPLLQSWQQVLSVAVPVASSNLAAPVTTAILTWMIAGYGTSAVAAFGVVTRLEGLLFAVTIALASTLSPFVGQNWGAQQLARVTTAVKLSTRFVYIWGITMLCVLMLFGGFVVRLFNADPDVIAVASLYFMIVPISYGFSSSLRLHCTVLSVVNKPVTATFLTMTQHFLLCIPLAYIGGHFWQLHGLFMAITLSYFISAWLAWRTLHNHLIEQTFSNQALQIDR